MSAAPAPTAIVSSTVIASWLDAARAGLWMNMRELFESGSGTNLINAADSNGTTALMIVCEEGHEECISELLRKGANVDQCDSTGSNALLHACEGGSASAIRLLFEASEKEAQIELNLNHQDSLGETALHKCARSLELECMKLLIEYTDQKIDVEIVNEAGDTALLVALANGTKDCLPLITYLLTNPINHAKVNHENKLTSLTPLLVVMGASDQCWELIKFLSTVKDIDIDKTDPAGCTALMHCIMDELPISYVKHFLEVCKANQLIQNRKGYTALHLAIRDSNLTFVELLLSQLTPKSSTKEPTTSTPSASTSSSSNSSITDFTLVKSTLITLLDNEFGWTPLQHASVKNEKEIVKLWGEMGFDVNSRDKRGSTALHLAARFGFLTCVKYLVKFGAQLNAQDLTGNSPIFDAITAGQLEVCKFLKDKGANIKLVDQRNNNILHKIVSKESILPTTIDLIKLFCDGGSKDGQELIHGVNLDHDTPWSIAQRLHHSTICDLFTSISKSSLPLPPTITHVISGDQSLVVSFEPPQNYKYLLLEFKYEVIATPVDESRSTNEKSLNGQATEEEEKKLIKKKKPDEKAAIKKPSTNPTASKSTSSITKASSTSGSLTNPKKSSSTSTTTKRPVVHALPTPQSAIGTTSPIRLNNLINGISYSITVRSINSIGASSLSPPWRTCVMVGTPAPPSITQITTGPNYALIAFMPPTQTASTNHDSSENKSTITEFIVSLHPSADSKLPRRGSGTQLPLSSADIVDRTISAVSSPVIVTSLTPGISYNVTIRSKNGYGDGSPTPIRAFNTTESTAGSPPLSSSSDSSSTSIDAPRLIAINELNFPRNLDEVSSLLSSFIGPDLHALFKSQRKVSGGEEAHFTITTVQRVENAHLQKSYDSAPLFMQAMGCTRNESTREIFGFICLPSTNDADSIIKHGILPLSHPLAYGYVAGTSSNESGSYNQNQYSLGSPYRGCYLNTILTKKLLINAMTTKPINTKSTTSSSTDSSISSATLTPHHLLFCKVLPGRVRTESNDPSIQQLSTTYDSHRSSKTGEIYLYSTNQILPLYLVQFQMDLTNTSDTIAIDEIAMAEDADAHAQAYGSESHLDDSRQAPIRAPSLNQGSSQQQTRGFGMSKWLGAAPASSMEAPGELPISAMGNSNPSSSTVSTSSTTRPSLSDDETDPNESSDLSEPVERLDINKSVSSLLGPVNPPKRKPLTTTNSTAVKPASMKKK